MSSEPDPTARLSIVIPTKNRPDRLAETVAAIVAERPDDEIVVVDDGSDPAVLEAVRELTEATPGCRRLERPPGGPAAARNAGVEAATHERVVLLGDDTAPCPGCLDAHAATDVADVGLQGRIDWSPATEITRVMRFLAPEGPQFYFAGLVDGQEIGWPSVLGSNFSAPRAWFLEAPFDEGFPHASFEDTELAYRWSRLGRRFRWSESARCWHHHVYDRLEPFVERQRRAGASARLAVSRHGGMFWTAVGQPTVVGLAFAVRAALRWATGRGRLEDRWDLACRWAFLRGFLSGPTRETTR